MDNSPPLLFPLTHTSHFSDLFPSVPCGLEPFGEEVCTGQWESCWRFLWWAAGYAGSWGAGMKEMNPLLFSLPCLFKQQNLAGLERKVVPVKDWRSSGI